jgi:PAS domain-containing protein
MSRHQLSTSLHTVLITISLCAAALFFYEQKQSEEVAAQFRTAVRGAGAGQWYWDVDKNILRWDDRMFVIFHCSKSGWKLMDTGVWEWRGSATDTPADKFASTLVDEDKPFVMAALQKAVLTKGSYQAVFRIVGEDGVVHPIRAGGAAYGGGRYMTGLCMKFISSQREGSLFDSSYNSYTEERSAFILSLRKERHSESEGVTQ